MLSDGSVVKVTKITEGHIYARKFRNLGNFYNFPIESGEQLQIYKASGLANHSSRWLRLDVQIVNKFMYFSCSGINMLIPFIHESY